MNSWEILAESYDPARVMRIPFQCKYLWMSCVLNLVNSGLTVVFEEHSPIGKGATILFLPGCDQESWYIHGHSPSIPSSYSAEIAGMTLALQHLLTLQCPMGITHSNSTRICNPWSKASQRQRLQELFDHCPVFYKKSSRFTESLWKRVRRLRPSLHRFFLRCRSKSGPFLSTWGKRKRVLIAGLGTSPRFVTLFLSAFLVQNSVVL